MAHRRLHVIVVIAVLIIALLASMYYGSRAFALGVLTSAGVLAWIWFGKQLSKLQVALGVFCLVGLLFVLATVIKPDSSLGRILIYKVSWNMFRDEWLMGIGMGNFKTTYLYYQAAYFERGNYTQKELLLADNTRFAFNDYFQFVIETGVPGMIFLCLAFASIVWAVSAALRNKGLFFLPLSLSLIVLISIATAACFTYVFYYLHFQLPVLAAVAVIVFYAVGRTTHKVIAVGVTLIIATVLLSLPYRFSYRYYIGLYKLTEIKEAYRAGFRTEAIRDAESLKPSIGTSAEYLDFMSFVYASEGRSEQAIAMTNQLLHDRVSNNLLERLGNQYYAVGDYSKAENAYTLCVNMVPNRFLTRHTLFNFYKKTGQKRKAMQCGREILTLPVKIPSYRVDYVIKSVQADLANMLKSPD